MWSNTSSGQHWYKQNTNTAVSLKTDPHRFGGGMMWRNVSSETTMSSSNAQHIKTATAGNRKGSLSLCWLMSFPVSIAVLILRITYI